VTRSRRYLVSRSAIPLPHAAGFVSALLLAGGGCWEEIHYVPKPAAAESEEGADRVADAQAAGQPPTDTARAPTSRDLFDSQPITAGPVEPAESSPRPSDDYLDPEVADEATADATPAPGEVQQQADETVNGPPMERTATPAQRQLVWQAASQWSLAAAIYAKGLDAQRYGPILDQANAAAQQLGIELPPLPTAGMDSQREASVIDALRGEPAATLVQGIADRFTPAEAAAADLAIRTRLLLLTYSPRSAAAVEQAAAVRQSAEASGLPADVWQPLVELLDERAPFAAVRPELLFELDRRASKHFAAAKEPGHPGRESRNQTRLKKQLRTPTQDESAIDAPVVPILQPATPNGASPSASRRVSRPRVT